MRRRLCAMTYTHVMRTFVVTVSTGFAICTVGIIWTLAVPNL